MLNVITGQLAGGVPAATNSYESIQTISVGVLGATSVQFTSIPSTYKHLQIRGIARDTGITFGTGLQVALRMNSDTGTNYADHFVRGQGASAAAGGSGNKDRAYVAYYPGSASSNTQRYGVMIIDVLDYANTNKFKTIRALSGDDLNGSGTVALASGLWRSTSAITTIQLLPNDVAFAEYSSFALYGIKG